MNGYDAAGLRLLFDSKAVQAFCEKWQIVELALFGSVARGAAGPDSDIDFMVEFSQEADLGLLDLSRMQDELEALFGQKVDLIEKGTIRNPFRRASIERDLTVVYAASG